MDPKDMYEKTGVLIDGNNFLYRTYHVLKHQAKGDLTQGFIAYSFVNQIRNLLPKLGVLNPLVYIVWDDLNSRVPRQNIFPAYKGNRPPTNSLIHETRDSLRGEMGKICQRLSVGLEGIEADDLMHMLSAHPSLHKYTKRWIICTRDEDLMQSITEDVRYYNPYSKKIWDLAMFEEKYGFEPLRIVPYKALVGDTADNWPGVAGIGKVTANKLLRSDSSMDEVFEAIHEKLKVKDEAKTKERIDQFFKGLQLCELPFRSPERSRWLKYLQEILDAPIENDWSHFHEVFKINAVDKCTFQIGKMGDA